MFLIFFTLIVTVSTVNCNANNLSTTAPSTENIHKLHLCWKQVCQLETSVAELTPCWDNLTSVSNVTVNSTSSYSSSLAINSCSNDKQQACVATFFMKICIAEQRNATDLDSILTNCLTCSVAKSSVYIVWIAIGAVIVIVFIIGSFAYFSSRKKNRRLSIDSQRL